LLYQLVIKDLLKLVYIDIAVVITFDS